MKKKFLVVILVLIVPIALLFTGCSQAETVINAMTKHWEDIMSKSGWWLNCGKCKDMEKFFKSVIIDNKIPLTRQETEINFILEHQIKELKGEK